MTTTYAAFLARTMLVDAGYETQCRVPVSIRWPGKPLKVTWDGYTQVTIDGRRGRSHRIAWELANGPVPSGLTLDHLCRYRPCCEVTHLDPVPMSENALRGDLPGVARDHLTRISTSRQACGECGMESNPGGVARHQKYSGHLGVMRVGR